MKIWILCFLLAASWHAPAWGQAITPVGNPLKELRASLATLDATRIPTGIFTEQGYAFYRPQALCGAGRHGRELPGL